MIGNYYCYEFGLNKDLPEQYCKHDPCQNRLRNCNSSKVKNRTKPSTFQKSLLQELKNKPQPTRKYLQRLYLIQDLCLEYIYIYIEILKLNNQITINPIKIGKTLTDKSPKTCRWPISIEKIFKIISRQEHAKQSTMIALYIY